MAIFNKKVKDDLVDEEEAKEKSGLNKKFLIPIIAVIVIVVMFGAKTIMSKVGGGDDELKDTTISSKNFFNDFNSVFTNDLGHFKYQLEVKSGDKGSLINGVADTNTSAEELSNLESADDSKSESDDSSGSEEKEDPKHKFTDWEDYASIKIENWTHPTFTIIVEGQVNNVDPLEATFSVDINTAYNDKDTTRFTDVTVKEGVYYLSTASMKTWLLGSGDAYLMDLGHKFPDTAKYMKLSEDDFKLYSRYASEDGKSASATKGIYTPYKRFVTALTTITGAFRDSLGNRGQEVKDTGVKLSLTGEDAQAFANGIQSIASQLDALRSSIISTGQNSGLYDEGQLKEVNNESATFNKALSVFVSKVASWNVPNMGFQVLGETRLYKDSENNDAMDVSFGTQFQTSDTDYAFQFTGSRTVKPNDIKDITETTSDYDEEVYNNILDIVNTVTDYFNPTSINLSAKSGYQANDGYSALMNLLIDAVNSEGSYDKTLTLHNVKDFIKEYTNFEPSEDSTVNDTKNAEFVASYFDTLDLLTSGLAERKSSDGDDQVGVKYPEATGKVGNIEFTVSYNEKESTMNVSVFDLKITNKSKKKAKIDLTMFEIHNNNSIFPANNKLVLTGVSSKKLKSSVKVNGKKKAKAKLYFSLGSNINKELKCFYGENELGIVVNK